MEKLNVQSIFKSIDGEANGFGGAGELTTFIRLKGCNLRCNYCLVGCSLIRVVDKNHKISHRRIRDIKVGQKVLGFNFEQNKIVETEVIKKFVHRVNKEELLRIELNGGGNYNTLYVTREHPFYSKRHWIRAEKLKVGDEIYTLPLSYLNAYSAKFRDNTIIVRVGKARKGVKFSTEHIKKMCISAKRREAGMSSKQKSLRAMKGFITASKRGRVSDCEKYFIDLFNEFPIRYVGNAKVWIGRKNPDFIVVGQKKVIEITDKTAIFRDFDKYKKERTAHFEEYGYKCLVLSIPEYPQRTESKNNIKDIIANFIMNGKKITKISKITDRQYVRIGLNNREGEKRKHTSKIKVYNLECSPHHNYFVNNMLSHNCDTLYAQNPKPENWMTTEEILKEIGDTSKITITGGEPLYQDILPFLARLLDLGKDISVETNGSLPIFTRDRGEFNWVWWGGGQGQIRWVVDYKLPSSGMEEFMVPVVFNALREVDVIKFVIADMMDYRRALKIVKLFPSWKAKKVFSPTVIDQKDYTGWPARLAEMMIQDNLYDIQYSLQIHKCLWPNAKQER